MTPSVPPPQPMPAPPTYADAAVSIAGQRQRTAARRAAGTTVLTSPGGDMTATPIAKKSLLGE